MSSDHLSSLTSTINLSPCNYVLVSLLHIYSDTFPSSEGSYVGQKNLWVTYTNRVSSEHLSSLTSAINLSPCNYVLVSLLHIYSDTFPSSEGSRVGQKSLGVAYINRVPSDYWLTFIIVSDVHSVLEVELQVLLYSNSLHRVLCQ